MGLPMDKAKGIDLYHQAADLSNSPAMFNLGVCYQHGDGVMKDFARAALFFKRSADLGYQAAAKTYLSLAGADFSQMLD